MPGEIKMLNLTVSTRSENMQNVKEHEEVANNEKKKKLRRTIRKARRGFHRKTYICHIWT